jgi:two-component system, NarL family, sensor histidine kinase UhpB
METSKIAAVTARAHAVRIDADEIARRHLARELHDSVGAELAATHFALASARASLPTDTPTQCADALALVERSLSAAIGAMRQVLDGLSAPQLETGLVAALADWTRGFGARTGLVTSFAGGVDLRIARIEADAALAVFRVAQEALANVARHARAAHAEVRLDCAPRHLVLTITDDGIGLPRGASRAGQRRTRYGLAGMRERCAAFGGTLRAGGRGAEPGTAVCARFAWDTLCVATAAPRASFAKGVHR